MKSLKRTLCLVLALVMVLGLFGVASASSFTDDNAIQYKEAVDVMTGIGAISGMGDGTFNPKGTITRAQAAKLVTYAVLGQDTAERLSVATSSFTDVTAAGGFGWAIPSIEYLVKEGVINGMGDGTFNPNGEISGTATLKMLLCALGYGKKSEYVGQGWDFQVALDANKLGLTDGRANTASIEAPATREEVALYCFNTIQKETVKYVATLDIYVDNTDASIMKTVYGGTGALTKTPGKTTDAYGRPATEWTYKGETICTAPQKPILSYLTAITAEDLGLAISNAGYKGNDADIAEAAEATGAGILTEVYGNPETKAVTDIIILATGLTEATDYEEDKAATTNIDERTITITGFKDTIKATDKIEGFDAVYSVVKALKDSGKDKVPVLVTMNNDGDAIAALGVPQTVDAKVTSVKNNATDKSLVSFVADGKTYTVGAAATDATMKKDGSYIAAPGNTITIIMDKNGYVLGAAVIDSTLNVGIVLDHGTINSGFDGEAGFQLKLLGLDGKEVVLPVSKMWNPSGGKDGSGAYEAISTDDKTGNYDAFAALDDKIITYTPDNDAEGKFAVTEASTAKTKAAFETGKVELIAGTLYANDSTVFVVQTIDTAGKKSYTVYTGINNVPSLTAEDYEVFDKPKADSFADVVYVLDAKLTGAGTSKLAFVAVDTDNLITLANGKTVFDAALITGSSLADIKQVQVLSSVVIDDKGQPQKTFAPIVTGYTLNADETMITAVSALDAKATKGNKFGTDTGFTRASNGVIEIGSTSHTYTSDCTVWIIDKNETEAVKKFVNKPIGSVATDEAATVYFVEDAETGKVSAVYIIKEAVGQVTLTVGKDTATAKKDAIVQAKKDGTFAWDDTSANAAAPVVEATATANGIDPFNPTYKWEYCAPDAKNYEDLTGGNKASFTLDADNFKKDGTYKIRCTVEPGKGENYSKVVKEFNLEVKVGYEIDAPAWSASATAPTGWDFGGDIATSGGYSDGDTVTFTMVAPSTTDVKKITIALTTTGSAKVASYTVSEVAGSKTYSSSEGVSVEGGKTYTFTITDINAPITKLEASYSK